MVKKIMIDFHETNWVNKVKNYKIKMIYQSASDYFSYVDLINLLNYNKNALFIVNSLEDDKFGIFLDEPIIFNKENKFISEANKLILISFKHKIMIKYIGDNPALKIDEFELNQELKLALVALLTTCALLDPTRQRQETESFFNRQLNILQKNQTSHQKGEQNSLF